MARFRLVSFKRPRPYAWYVAISIAQKHSRAQANDRQPQLLVTDSKLMLDMLIRVMVGKGTNVDDDDGGYKSWSKDGTHRREAQVLGVFRDIWPDRNGPLPWRLTPEQVKMLDERMSNVICPHYIDRLHYEGCSFWIKPGRMWKTRRKVYHVCHYLQYIS